MEGLIERRVVSGNAVKKHTVETIAIYKYVCVFLYVCLLYSACATY